MTKTRLLTASLMALSFSSTALAGFYAPPEAVQPENVQADQRQTGLYLSLRVGPSSGEDLEGTTMEGKGTKEHHTGFAFAGAAGYKYKELRGEVEVGYSRNNVDNLKIGGVNNPDLKGYTVAIPVMLNFMVDLFEQDYTIHPYVGAGLGFVNMRSRLKNTGMMMPFNFTDSHTDFAYQGIVGVNCELSATMNLGVDYRILQTNSSKNHKVSNNATKTDLVKDHYNHHSLNLVLTAFV